MDKLALLQEKYKLTEKENETIFQGYILPRITFQNHPNTKRLTAILVGGQPGSGKSSLMHVVKKEMEHDSMVVAVASDDYRHFHSRYNEILLKEPELAPMVVTPDADIWTSKLLNTCIDKKVNIVLEGTMGKAAWALDKQGQLKQNGYNVAYKIMAVKPLLSKVSTLNRFVEMKRTGVLPRFVTMEAHDVRFNGLFETVEALSKQTDKQVSLYIREIKHGQTNGYTDNLKILNQNPIDPLLDFKKQTGAPLNLLELDYIRKSILNLQNNGIGKEMLTQAFPNFVNENTRRIKF